MARLPRLAAAGYVHLLTQRGHNGEAMFRDDRDRERFVQLLREAALAHRVAIHAWALADSELLLLATPAEAPGLGRMMQALGRRYVGEFNRRHARSGTLWDGRFRATAIEAETWLLDCLCYVELAALRAGSASEAQAQRWSSARHHLGLAPDALVSDHPLYWAIGNTPFEREAAHRRLLERGLGAAQARTIADAAAKGWALGSAPFAALLAERSGRRVVPGKRGRPRGKTEAPVPASTMSPNK
ncbi:MAG: transposase [Ideonella sp.]|nr:transposase [Ideonella sp.]